MIGDSPILPDPLTEVVALLRPDAAFSKLVVAGGAWAVRVEGSQPFYCAVLEGRCRVAIAGSDPLPLQAGDFVLIPGSQDFTALSMDRARPGTVTEPIQLAPGHYRLGDPAAEIDMRMLVGHCTFGSDDAPLLVSLLPRLVHVRGEPRLTLLVELLDGEVRADRPGRAAMLSRLVELLLIEALRTTGGVAGSPGLLRGLADARLTVALRRMHDHPDRSWTVAALARAAGLSRSTFFERFQREVGMPPMAYLLGWRMALAKAMLDAGGERLARVAERVGYGSVSTFSTAFSRHVGRSPARYVQDRRRSNSREPERAAA